MLRPSSSLRPRSDAGAHDERARAIGTMSNVIWCWGCVGVFASAAAAWRAARRAGAAARDSDAVAPGKG